MVATVTSVVPTGTGPTPAASPPPAGFAAVLATQQVAASARVTLGQMLHHAAQGPVALPAPTPTAVRPAVGAPAATPAGPLEPSAVISAAERYLGVPYLWGGTDPAKGLDCSGFVQRVFADLGVPLPRVSADQARAGVAVPDLASARPGDLVYWGGGNGRPNHIGIYAGNGQMVVAPRTGDVVRYQSLRTAAPDAIRRVLP